jgi:hypothetical protein
MDLALLRPGVDHCDAAVRKVALVACDQIKSPLQTSGSNQRVSGWHSFALLLKIGDQLSPDKHRRSVDRQDFVSEAHEQVIREPLAQNTAVP